MREIIEGFGKNIIPISVVHRYMVGNGLIDQTVSLKEYIAQLIAQKEFILENTNIIERDIKEKEAAAAEAAAAQKKKESGLDIEEDKNGAIDSEGVTGKKAADSKYNQS